jgi:hypothetical protein
MAKERGKVRWLSKKGGLALCLGAVNVLELVKCPCVWAGPDVA